jgi:two-component system KDP operon response regulator KdpE
MDDGPAPNRILVIDDETGFRRGLGISLRARGFDVDLADTGEVGLRLAEERRPEVIVLDLGLPGIDGLSVLEQLRSWTDVPVIVLSARSPGEATVAALDSGADDFVAKPFSMDELMARLRAALRRTRRTSRLDAGELVIDFDRKRLSVHERDVHLTPIEWKILELLVRNEDRPVAQSQILRAVWGPHIEEPNDYVRVHLSSLRHKIEPDPAHPRYILTERGMGYRFVRPATPTSDTTGGADHSGGDHDRNDPSGSSRERDAERQGPRHRSTTRAGGDPDDAGRGVGSRDQRDLRDQHPWRGDSAGRAVVAVAADRHRSGAAQAG